MANTNTTKLGLVKPTPGTGEPYNRSQENNNLDKIDAAAGLFVTTSAARAAMTAYQGQIVLESNTGKVYVCTTAPNTWGEVLLMGGSFNGASAGTNLYTSRVSGDTNSRYQVTVAGGMNWGSGSASPDVNLYRGGVDILQTDDRFVADSFAPVGGTGAYVGEDVRTTTSANFTTTEIVLQSYTFAARSGTRYKVTYHQYVESTVALDNAQMNLRWVGGNTAGIGDFLIRSHNPAMPVANKGQLFTMACVFQSSVTGNVTVSVSSFRSSGTGTLKSVGGTGQQNTILVERA